MLLNNRRIGKRELQTFVDERMLSHSKSPFDRVKKVNIPVFNYMEYKPKKKETKPVTERSELKSTGKILKILDDRKVIPIGEIGRYQISQHHALTDPREKEVKPNVKSSKAKAISNYVVKVCPDSVSRAHPPFDGDSTVTVIEARQFLYGLIVVEKHL